jgi:hypothetical protein
MASPGREAHLQGMKIFLAFLLGAAMLATLGVLFAGIFGISAGNPGRSNRLMQWRVALQATALLLFILLMMLLKS